MVPLRRAGAAGLVFTDHQPLAYCDLEGCESTLARYVWAGDQLLYETRAPAADSLPSSTLETDTPGGDGEYGLPKAYGTVGYTHAGGIDRPLGVMRMNNGSLTTAFYPQLNWRGLYETATTDTGTQFASRDFIKWPGAVASAYLGANTKPDSAFWWYGSQITESADASGLMYRRNRYYDPASGRFTQPDPAGIGGGLSSYGFASGDPVNYADPYGLASVGKSCPPDCREITPEEGNKIATAAEGQAADYQKAHTPYKMGGSGVQGADCIHFCKSAQDRAGLSQIPLTQSGTYAGNPHFKEVPLSEARRGDVLWQPRGGGNGHVGIFLGTRNPKGGLIGAEMGNSGARANSVWGTKAQGGWFAGGEQLKIYRPLVPKE